MLQVKQFVFNPFQVNTYVLYQPQAEAVVIDPACSTNEEFQELVDFIEQQGLALKFLVNTHCHIDHILGIQMLKEHFGVKTYAHIDDLPLLQMAPGHAMMFGLYLDTIPTIDDTLTHGNLFNINDSKVEIIHTPGHTKGGICLYSENDKLLITGDTLFNLSIGRTDLPGGSYETLIKSIKEKLMVLPDDVQVYPGHGNRTSIGFERKSNPFI